MKMYHVVDTSTGMVLFLPGDWNIQPHFTVEEFACNDGNEIIFINFSAVKKLEELRLYINAPIIISSGFRTLTHNKNEGGVVASRHMYGDAFDIYSLIYKPEQLFDKAIELFGENIGLHAYQFRTHIDFRGRKARW